MSSTAMDLDSSLDDIIKKRQKKKANNNNNKGQKNRSNTRQQRNNNKAQQPGRQRGGNNNKNGGRRNNATTNNRPAASNLLISNRSRTIGKRNRLNLRSGGQKPTIDPKNIVITKTLSHPAATGRRFVPLGVPTERGLSIRGAAYGTGSSAGLLNGAGGISIRGESGPATVLITNLDPAVNADDVRMICSQFGQVTHCEVIVDRTGRSFGEAEVEFAQKSSALDCVARLDNEVADGRLLRVILRNRPTSVPATSGFIGQPLRSVIAPTRSGFTSA